MFPQHSPVTPYTLARPVPFGGVEAGDFDPSVTQAGGPLPAPVQPQAPVELPGFQVEADPYAVRDSQDRIIRSKALGRAVRALGEKRFGRT